MIKSMKTDATMLALHSTAARRRRAPRTERMAFADDAARGFRNVLVGVDGTSTGRDAIALAKRLQAEGGSLTLAHVALSRAPAYPSFHATPSWKATYELLERERDLAGAAGELTVISAPSVGHGLHQLAADHGADLLVVGSCVRGSVGSLLRGDDTRGSLTGAPCAVAVAPIGYHPEVETSIETIGVAYNSSPEADAALAVARGLAAQHDARLRAVTVIWPTGWSAASAARWALTFDAEERAACERLESLVAVEGDVIFGPPAEELAAFAQDVDLLVVGSRSHGPVRRLVLGSTSEGLARSARRPVLVVPRAGTRPQSRCLR